MKRFLAVLKARNREFWRDKSSLGWNLIFPILMLAGFALVFSGDGRAQYKVGLLNSEGIDHEFIQTRYVEFVHYESSEKAKAKVGQHAIDLLVELPTHSYWINESSPKGYFVEQLLLGHEGRWNKQEVEGKQVRYLDWVVPGILGMNMMFSCLFGVGYVIVRYRKNMVLKRLGATPLTAFEFVSAQLVSRLFIVLAVTGVVFTACNLLFDFYMIGSYFDLFIVAMLGGFCLISLGLFVASRSRSEELTGGLLNLVTWPMMVLSGVWFSLEGAPDSVQTFSQLLPLTHMLEAARAIMTSGATLNEVSGHLLALCVMTALFLGVGSVSFRWDGDGR